MDLSVAAFIVMVKKRYLPRRRSVLPYLEDFIFGFKSHVCFELRGSYPAEQNIPFSEGDKVIIDLLEEVFIPDYNANRGVSVVEPPLILLFEGKRNNGVCSFLFCLGKSLVLNFWYGKICSFRAIDFLYLVFAVFYHEGIDALIVKRSQHFIGSNPHSQILDKQLVDDLRRQLALRYVKDPRLRLSQLGFLLGFSENAAFVHAFRRWTGSTPMRYRAANGDHASAATRPRVWPIGIDQRRHRAGTSSAEVDAWRREQPAIPSESQAFRRADPRRAQALREAALEDYFAEQAAQDDEAPEPIPEE